MNETLFGLPLNRVEFSALMKVPPLEQSQGSLTLLEKLQVALLMMTCQPEVIVETGVWRGRTTRFMAEFLSLNNINGHIYAFDLPEVLEELNQGDTWFQSAPNVTLMPGLLPVSLNQWLDGHDKPIDFALVDAYHSFHAVAKELGAIAPRLSPRGYIFCHDYGGLGSKYEGVMCAVNEAANKFNLSILPLWSAEDAGAHTFCQAAILHRTVSCPASRKLFHRRKYFAQEYPALAFAWGRLRHWIFGD